MAIGVSYRGHDGRTETFTTDGNPAAGSALDQIVRGRSTGSFGNLQSPMADLMRRSHKAVAPDPRIDKAAGSVKLDPMDQRPGTLKDKLDPSGSIDAGMRGLRLKGDDSTANNVVYGRHAGQSKFVTLDEIDDPTIKGQVIGANCGGTSVDSDGNVSSNSTEESGDEAKDGPYRVNMQSRMEATVDNDEGKVTLYEFTKPIDVTTGRRVGMIGAETKREVCSFFLGSGAFTSCSFSLNLYEIFQVCRGYNNFEYWAFCPREDDGVAAHPNSIYYDGHFYSGEGSGMYPSAGSIKDVNGVMKVDGCFMPASFWEPFVKRGEYTGLVYEDKILNSFSYLGNTASLGSDFDLYGCTYGHDGIFDETRQAIVAFRSIADLEDLKKYIMEKKGRWDFNYYAIIWTGKIASIKNHVVNQVDFMPKSGNCTAHFLTEEGQLISTQSVSYGGSAYDPNPSYEWGGNIKRVIKDTCFVGKKKRN